eukprot:scaffold199405_cov37-Tisochrysis_lutea.AAC.3
MQLATGRPLDSEARILVDALWAMLRATGRNASLMRCALVRQSGRGFLCGDGLDNRVYVYSTVAPRSYLT